MREISTDAFILKRSRYGESDQIVVFYTLKLGKISAVAKGALRSQKRFGGRLEPFMLLCISLKQAENKELLFLQGCEIKERFRNILENLRRIAIAASGLEICREFTPDRVPDSNLFKEVKCFLEGLDSSSQVQEIFLRFKLKVLTLLGFQPRLETCGYCNERVRQDKRYYFNILDGGIVCRDCGRGIKLESETLAILTQLGTKDLKSVYSSFNKNILQEGNKVIDIFLSHTLGRQLKTQSLIKRLGM
jgi:DNA repair protein RecO (recombination protein O)